MFWRKKKKEEKQMTLQLNCLQILFNTIDEHYSDSKKTLYIEISPRKFWELACVVEIRSSLFNTFRACEDGSLSHCWVRGAKLVRVEVT